MKKNNKHYMQTVKELIEQLQPHNLPHMADGSFNITEAQHAAILSLLSQQSTVSQTDEEDNEAAYKYIVDVEKIPEITWWDSDRNIATRSFLAGCQHVRQQLSQQEVVDLQAKVDFYRDQTSKLRTYINENHLGKPSQGLFEILYEHIQELKSTPSQQQATKWLKLKEFIQKHIQQLDGSVLTTSGEDKLALLKDILAYADESAPLSQQQQQREVVMKEMAAVIQNLYDCDKYYTQAELKELLTKYNNFM